MYQVYRVFSMPLSVKHYTRIVCGDRNSLWYFDYFCVTIILNKFTRNSSMTDLSLTRKRKPGFKKGDPRINRKGRPKAFDTVRFLAQSIAEEPARDTNGNVIVMGGHVVTIVEKILRSLAMSPNYKANVMFLEFAYGKIPEEITVKEDHEQLSDDERTTRLVAIFEQARARRD